MINTTETHDPPSVALEVDPRWKRCTKCGDLKYHSEFAWMNGRMERKALCKDCAGYTCRTLGSPQDNLKSPEDARSELEVIFSKELGVVPPVLHDHNTDNYRALITRIPPRPLSSWHLMSGLPVSMSPRDFKGYMLHHYDDDYLITRILRDYEVAKGYRAKTQRDKRSATKARVYGDRSCLHCSNPLGPNAHMRKRFCNGTCRQAYARRH